MSSSDYHWSPQRIKAGRSDRRGSITPSTSVEDLGVKLHGNGNAGTNSIDSERGGRVLRDAAAVTPPPRKDSIGANSITTPSFRTASRQSSLNVPYDSESPTRHRQGSQLLSPERVPPPPPILDSTPASPTSPSRGHDSPVAPPRLKFITSNLSASSSPRNSLPSASTTTSTGNPSPASSTFQNASRDVSSKTLSAQSTLSAATSNSSHLPVPQSSPYPASTSSFTSDPEVTAGWIRMLYARLDAQGVRGDGWEEGKERTRDGIINREIAEGGQNAIRALDHRKSIVAPLNQDEEAKADQVLRRVDR